jgi:hypothetical protein
MRSSWHRCPYPAANEARFCTVPMLADEGVYLASASTFTRVLCAHGQTAHRVRAKAPRAKRPPTPTLPVLRAKSGAGK